MDNIFERVGPRLINDAYVLSHEYIPATLVARDEQIATVRDLVRPVLNGGVPNNAVIYGPTGTGKTLVVKHVLYHLQRFVESGAGVGADVAGGAAHNTILPVFVSCKEINATSHILHHILGIVSPDVVVPKYGIAISRYYQALWGALNSRGVSLLVVFDEIEYLRDTDILYNFSRVGENQSLSKRLFVSVVGLTNDLQYLDALDPRVLSSLGAMRVVFPAYNADELVRILSARAELAFVPDVLGAGVVEMCAARSAREHGDARKALLLLAQAGGVADSEGCSCVSVEHVERAAAQIELDHVRKTVLELPSHSRLVLLAVIKLSKYRPNMKATTGHVERVYINLCRVAGEGALSRPSISKTISELDMLGVVSASDVNRGRGGGRTRHVSATDGDGEIERELCEQFGVGIGLAGL